MERKQIIILTVEELEKLTFSAMSKGYRICQFDNSVVVEHKTWFNNLLPKLEQYATKVERSNS